MSKIVSLVLLIGLVACAGAPPLSDKGATVRVITPLQAQTCDYVESIKYEEWVLEMGTGPEMMKQIGEHALRNGVAEKGADSLVINKAVSDWKTGHLNYQGDGYRCRQIY